MQLSHRVAVQQLVGLVTVLSLLVSPLNDAVQVAAASTRPDEATPTATAPAEVTEPVADTATPAATDTPTDLPTATPTETVVAPATETETPTVEPTVTEVPPTSAPVDVEPKPSDPGTTEPSVAAPAPAVSPDAADATSILFIQNNGQDEAGARFSVRGTAGTIFFADDAIWIAIAQAPELVNGRPALSQDQKSAPREIANVRLTFVGANPKATVVGIQPVKAAVSFFSGLDAAAWQAGVPTFAGIRYQGLYPNLDLEITSQHGDWVWKLVPANGASGQSVTPGDLARIRLRLEGQDKVELNAAADEFGFATRHGSPVLPLLDISGLSFANGQARSEVAALHAHVEQDEIVTPFKAQRGGHLLASKGLFRMLGADQLVRPLAHDGNLARLRYSSFLGGDYSHYAIGVAVGSDGAVYVTGWTLAPALPAVPGYDTSPNGVADIFVAKLSPNGQTLSYMTFLGGSEDDFGYRIAVNASGEAAIVATIRSNDAPVPNGFDTDFNTGWTNPYVARLNAAGTSLLYGTYLGNGQGHDIAIQPGATDGVVYVTGFTVEDTFPITTTVGTEPLSNTYGDGGSDGFVSQLDTAQSGSASLRYSTYLGGESSDCDRGGDVIECSISVDAAGNVYVTGPTYSTDFPHTASAFSTTITGGSDAFLVRLALNGNGAGDLIYGTFFGGTGDECWESCAVSAAGPTQVFIAGQTDSGDMPANAGQTTSGGGVDGFVVRFDTTQSGASSRIYSTYLGRGGTDRLLGVVVRGVSGEVFVGGFTDSSDFPPTAGAFDSTFADADCGGYTCRDAFAARLDSSGDRTMFTYVGDNADDLGWDVAYFAGPSRDEIYLAGFSYSADFPVTASAWDQTNAGSDSFVTVIKDQDACGVLDLTLTAGMTCVLEPGSYAFNSITVHNGGTLILQGNPNAGLEGAGVTLTITSSLTVNAGGLLSANGQGFGPGTGPGRPWIDFGSAGYGGEGAVANFDPRYDSVVVYGEGAPGYGSLQQPTALGSGAAGPGGGAVRIVTSGTVTINGILSANGGSDGTGAGSGGSVWIQAATLTGSGSIQANGAAGIGSISAGINASGAGGRIALDSTTNTFSGTVLAQPGPSNGYAYFDPGGPGTVYFTQSNKVVVDGNNVPRGWRDRDFDAHPAVVVTGTYTLGAIELLHYGYLEFIPGADLTLTDSNVVTGDGTGVLTTRGVLTLPTTFDVKDYVLDIQGAWSGGTHINLVDTIAQTGTELPTVLALRAETPAHAFGDLNIGPRSYLLTIPQNDHDADYNNDAPFVLQAATVVVQSGGEIRARGLGYRDGHPSGMGPGGGMGFNEYNHAAGGTHGGLGGAGSLGGWIFPQSPIYGDPKQPTTLGSAGGSADGGSLGLYWHGGDGGGAIHVMVSGSITVNGLIDASGSVGTGNSYPAIQGTGGGSGGSLWIQAPSISGSGAIKADGGHGQFGSPQTGYDRGSGGGGGRIAFDVPGFAFNGVVSAAGGIGYRKGGNGTITGLPFPRRSMRSASSADDAGICPVCEFVRTYGGPINSLTGVVDFSAIDLSFPALGGDVHFERTYSTDFIGITNTLGSGWTHSLDTRLIFADQPGGVAGQVLVKLHSANEFIFIEVIDPAAGGAASGTTYQPYPGVLATLVRDAATSTYRLTTKDQGVYAFKDSVGAPDHGKLITWTDPQGHVQTYAYDPTTGLLTGVTTGAGPNTRTLTIQYSAGRIDYVEDHTGRSVSFGYDGNGDLTIVTDVRGEVWTYAYDGASHRLASVTDPEGRIIERNEYDGDGRAWRQFNGVNQLVVELAYTSNPDGTTTVTASDAHGNTETLTYDHLGTLVTAVSPSGSVDKTFDGNFHAEAVSDENDNPTEYLWSENGQVLTQTVDALGNDTLFQYDALNNITRTVDARGNETTALYDGTFLTSTTNALSQQTLYTYTTGAEIPAQPAGLLKAMSNAAGETTLYGYNAYGQPVTVTDAAGQTMFYEYDDLGRVVTTTDSSGRVTVVDYNPAGQVVTTTANYLAGQPQNFQNLYNLITVHDYDGAGRLRWTRDTEGRTDWVCYDDAGRVNRTVQNATGDGLTPATDPCDAAYVASSDPAEDRIAETVYDDAGNVSATIDPGGIVSRTYFDDSNRPYLTVQNFTGSDLTGTITSTIPAWTAAFPDRNVRSQTVYDPVGNVLQTIDNVGLVSATCYDELNRPVKTVQNPSVTDPCAAYQPTGYADQDIIETTDYDENGNDIATTDTLGHVTRTWYDVLNRPIAVTVNFTGTVGSAAPDHDPAYPDQNLTTETFSDEAGRVYKTVDRVWEREDWTCYDDAGRVTRTVQNAQGNPCETGWSPSSAPDEDVATTYSYDVTTGRQIAVTAADGQITRTYFDETGRQAAQTANLTGQAIAVETVPAYNPAFPDQNVTTRWGYDALGRTITTTVAAGSAQAQTTYTCYDALGRVAKTVLNPTVADPCGSYTPSSQTDRDVATIYTYDAAGNQIATTDALGHITRTYYDDLGRTIAVVANLTGQGIAVETVPAFDPTFPDRNVRAFTSYDAAGRVLETIDNAGLVTRSTYDSLGRVITTTVNYVSGGPVNDTTNLASGSVYDKLGNVTRSIDAEGVTTGFDYDWVGRLITVTENLVVLQAVTESQNVRTIYAYDGRGNRLTITDGNGHITTFTYDDLDRQRTETDALSHTWTTNYTKVGLTVSLLDANGQTTGYAYDDLRRVTSIDYPAGTADVSYTYDALGNRATMTDGTGVTSWALDALNRPITITAPSGAVGYGYDRLGNRTQLRYPDTKAVTYTVDALNRIATVQDWASAFTSYTYNAAGQVVTTTLPNGVRTVYGYDAAQRLQTLTHSTTAQTLGAYTYMVNTVGNRTAVTETLQSLETTAASPDLFDTIYADGFEAGDLAGWYGTSGTGLSVSGAAALAGSLGYSVAITSTTARYVESRLPTAEKHYRARFAFDPNAITMTSGTAHFIFRGYVGTSTDVVQVEFRRNGTSYELRAGGRNDASAYTYTPWTVITDAAHWVELDWKASTAAGANNGAVALWIDQVAAGSVTTLDNDTRVIDTVRLGAVFGLVAGTTGTLYFDAFEDRRVHTTIGTEARLPDRLFTNSFETNSLAYWVTSGPGITVTTAANLAPGQSLGASVVVTTTQTSRYLEDLTPNRESRYRARVYFDPNGLTMAVNNSFNILNIYTGTTEIGRLEFQYVATGYRLRGAVRNDASAYTYTGWTTLTDSAHVLEIDWQSATAPGANNGGLTLWIDGIQAGALTTVDNDTRRVDKANIGAVGLDVGTTGTFYLDAFESRRSSAIGPVQVAGNALITTAIAYGYDPLYRLTSASYSDGTLFGYQYDGVGNVLTKTQTISGTPATQTYTYDDANRQTSAAGLAQTYDNNGNLVNDGATAYTWDGANRMTASGSTAYTYNGLNDRVSAGGATHRLDLNAGLTQVLADGTNTYLYGAGRLGEQQGAARQYHLVDGLGSVRQLADASGAVSAAKSYEPYGEVLSSTGTASSLYGFTGEQQDAGGKLIYLRARYYQAEAMRFASRDPYGGKPTVPASLNRWLYAFSNAVNRTDPSGYYPGCLRDARRYLGLDSQRAAAACAQIRVGEIAARQQNWLSFSQLFTDRELNGALSGVAGRTVEQRIVFILNLAGDKHVWAKSFGPSDCFLREEFRDSQFYNYADPQDPSPPEPDRNLWPAKSDDQGFSNQIGHFLDAVSFTRTFSSVSRSIYNSLGGGATGLAAVPVYQLVNGVLIAGIAGHELLGDQKGTDPQILAGVGAAVTRGLTQDFMNAVEYDRLGRSQARDRILARILFDSEGISDSYFDLQRPGNSIQDLRLTIKGYRFGAWSLGNSAPPTTGATWLRNNLIVRRNGPTR